MSPLATAVLAVAIAQAPPGRSSFSFEVVPECGQSADRPSCPLEPVCADDAPACRPPKWSAVRNGWVKLESRPQAIRRYASIARAIAGSAERLSASQSLGWGGSSKQLALAALTVALHESGLREDVQFGHPPLGRGPRGEACLLQIGLAQGPLYASWLPERDRAQVANDPKRREEFAKSLLGDSPAALGRCFEVGMRMLARARAACGKAGVAWDYGMFSMYGSGRTCRAPVVGRSRSQTFQRLLSSRAELPEDALGILREKSRQ